MSRRRHIPTPDGRRTYCGRWAEDVLCIDRKVDSIEDSDCVACGRVDDARSVRVSREETAAEKLAPEEPFEPSADEDPRAREERSRRDQERFGTLMGSLVFRSPGGDE